MLTQNYPQYETEHGDTFDVNESFAFSVSVPSQITQLRVAQTAAADTAGAGDATTLSQALMGGPKLSLVHWNGSLDGDTSYHSLCCRAHRTAPVYSKGILYRDQVDISFSYGQAH